MFPRKINGNFAMLNRPSDNGHTPFGDIFYSESPDMCFWGKHRHVMAPAPFEVSAWQCLKIGAGPYSYRDIGRLVADLSWRVAVMQWLCI